MASRFRHPLHHPRHRRDGDDLRTHARQRGLLRSAAHRRRNLSAGRRLQVLIFNGRAYLFVALAARRAGQLARLEAGHPPRRPVDRLERLGERPQPARDPDVVSRDPEDIDGARRGIAAAAQGIDACDLGQGEVAIGIERGETDRVTRLIELTQELAQGGLECVPPVPAEIRPGAVVFSVGTALLTPPFDTATTSESAPIKAQRSWIRNAERTRTSNAPAKVPSTRMSPLRRDAPR